MESLSILRAFEKIICLLLLLAVIAGPTVCSASDDEIDASDPTKIYSYAGGGVKYTDYTNDEEMWEARITGNLGISERDMVLFEVGYGWRSGDHVDGSNNDLTNGRARWFHVFDMDYAVSNGYRGWATQVDLQVAGSLKGTDGQNLLAIGALPAFGLGANWSFFLAVNIVNAWDKNFDDYNGVGLGVAPLLVYVPENWWPGAYVQLWPNYTRFVSSELSGEGSGNLDLVLGGSITPTVLWAVTYQKNFDEHLNSFRRGRDTGLDNDQNVFFSITTYFSVR